ncbi:hypothetical protein [Arthrobacter sp. M4]|uniref:hypothetical protein n=1 Tax=Arthrobacter sp. M4 TaxID=218160 RepID=UPI001CDBA537|nr:hypothetical protein [Arthrobacter sp. M4]MCA4135597.1 hypothetical protein [Arthrobacter sp. M4]
MVVLTLTVGLGLRLLIAGSCKRRKALALGTLLVVLVATAIAGRLLTDENAAEEPLLVYLLILVSGSTTLYAVLGAICIWALSIRNSSRDADEAALTQRGSNYR